jgi:glycosyltransferase involved in cell wall biosynthesis
MKQDVQKKAVWVINGHFVAQRLTGVQRYAHEIVWALDKILSENPDVENRLGLQLVMPRSAGSLPLEKIVGRTGSFGSGHLWEQLVLPWYQRTGILNLGNSGPVIARRSVVCIHDANTFLEPESYSKTFRGFYRALLPLIGRRAERVATVSEYSASTLVQFGVTSRDKIFVAPNGHEHVRRWNPQKATLSLIGLLKRPYVLLLGSRAKHKNIGVVLAGAQILDEAGIDLVVVGGRSKIFQNTLEVSAPNIRYVGYVSDHDLAALYQGALCLAFPSTAEGFGLPPLEAMACGCPVISSNTGSLREVGGDAVLYADPHERADWSRAIVDLLKHEHLRQDLIARGKRRAIRFSWMHSAEIYTNELLVISGSGNADCSFRTEEAVIR